MVIFYKFRFYKLPYLTHHNLIQTGHYLNNTKIFFIGLLHNHLWFSWKKILTLHIVFECCWCIVPVRAALNHLRAVSPVIKGLRRSRRLRSTPVWCPAMFIGKLQDPLELSLSARGDSPSDPRLQSMHTSVSCRVHRSTELTVAKHNNSKEYYDSSWWLLW